MTPNPPTNQPLAVTPSQSDRLSDLCQRLTTELQQFHQVMAVAREADRQMLLSIERCLGSEFADLPTALLALLAELTRLRLWQRQVCEAHQATLLAGVHDAAAVERRLDELLIQAAEELGL